MCNLWPVLTGRAWHTQTRKALIPRATFVQWARVDMHYNRRFMALAEMIYALRIKAERRGIWRQFRVVPPAKTVQAELVPFDALPEPFTPHQEVVRSDLHIKFAKPPHGLEALRTRAATDAVALRFVDARNRPASGIIGLDLSSIDWAGWEPLELREDLIFRPHTRSVDGQGEASDSFQNALVCGCFNALMCLDSAIGFQRDWVQRADVRAVCVQEAAAGRLLAQLAQGRLADADRAGQAAGRDDWCVFSPCATLGSVFESH
eukprot:1124296-Rhodomonas_salina.1